MDFTPPSSVYFVAGHTAPAEHFTMFIKELSNDATVHVIASGPALKKFQESGITVHTPFSLDKLNAEEEDKLADQIAKTCSAASVVVTDVGHAFSIKVQKALAKQKVRRLAYYENFMDLVPGGFSAVAAEVMLLANGVIFANAHLANKKIYREPGVEVDLSHLPRIGLGYFPENQPKEIAEKRKTSQFEVRAEFFAFHNVIENQQKVLVYFGGNNTTYFNQAFPAFLSFLTEAIETTDLSNTVIVLQQHPGAKINNIDGSLVEAWKEKHQHKANAPKLIISNINSEQAAILADAAGYYQTTMAATFVLAGIPTAQFAHEPYEDLLVKEKLIPTATTTDQFIQTLSTFSAKDDPTSRQKVLEGLGMRQDWNRILRQTLLGPEIKLEEKKPNLEEPPTWFGRIGSIFGL